MFEKVFPHDGTPFGAMWAAERWLAENGYSVGSSQAGSPRGILKGEWAIAKWRNIRPQGRTALDGELMAGRDRNAVIYLRRNAPADTQGEPSDSQAEER